MNGKHPIRLRMINAACIVVFILAMSFAGPRNRVAAAVSPVFIPANAQWVQTGIFLEQTHDVFLEAHGMAITGKINLLPESKSGPEGQVWNLGCGQTHSLLRYLRLDIYSWQSTTIWISMGITTAAST
jgi:hypothetical protein